MAGKIDVRHSIADKAERLSASLDHHMRNSFTPEDSKKLRKFDASEVASLLGVSASYLRRLHFEDKIPEVESDGRGRRLYSADEIMTVRRVLAETTSRDPRKFLPGRELLVASGKNPKAAVISFANFKGGSGKSTTASTAAHAFGLRGYRVLAIDLDPQASLTMMFGHRPEFEFRDGGTVYDALRYENPVPFRNVIHKTYFPNVDLVPAGLELSEYDTETSYALTRKGQDVVFFDRLSNGISKVRDDYDVIFIDCPPQLGFLTLTGLCASSGVIVTVIPSMMDVASMSQFLTMANSLFGEIESVGGRFNFDFFKFLISRLETSDGPHAQMSAYLRNIFGDDVMVNPFIKSTAIADAGLTQNTIYEMSRKEFHRNTYERAIEAIDAVMDEMEAMIQATWADEDAIPSNEETITQAEVV